MLLIRAWSRWTMDELCWPGSRAAQLSSRRWSKSQCDSIPSRETYRAGSGVFAQVELLHAIDQHFAADVEAFGRLGLVPVETLQRAENEFTLHRFDTDSLRRQFQLNRLHRRLLAPLLG